MNNSTIAQEFTISLQEERRCKPLMWIFHLRVRKSQPDFLNFINIKKTVYNFNVGSQECHICQILLKSLLSASVHTSTLDIDSYEIDISKHSSKTNRVFSFSTSQFKYNWIVVMEIFFPPQSFHIKRFVANHRIRILKDIRKCLHLRKFL